MSDPTAPVEGAPTSTEAAPSTPAADPYAPVLDRVNELASTLDGRFAALEQRIPAPEPQAEPDPWAALFPEAEEQQYEPQQPALDPAALRQAYQADLTAATAPLQQQLQQLHAAQAREQLLQQIPALKDPAVAQAHVDSMVQQMTAARVPVENIEWALSNPHMIATYFEAAEARKLAAGQAPANEQVPNVESAGGASPGGNGAPVNPVHQAYGVNRHEMPKGFA